MLNSLVIVGLVQEVEDRDTYTYIELLNRRDYKNEDGEHIHDKIPVYLMGKLKDEVKKDDLIAIRGRLQNKDNKLVVLAEKITLFNEDA